MTIQADFHVHTALSPCASDDMTPLNIVRMARLCGLDAIAITDHQTCGNCEAVMTAAAAQGGPVVLPGLEIETAEDIHLICLFERLESARKVEERIKDVLPDRQNRPDIFGRQIYYDAQDHCLGVEPRLLLQAARIDLMAVFEMVEAEDGVVVAAHISRESGGILTVLGQLPPDYPGQTLELAPKTDESDLLSHHPEIDGHRLIRGSDAHRLTDLAVSGWPLKLLPGQDDRSLARQIIFSLRHPPVT